MPCPDGMRPEDIEFLLSDDAIPLAHRKIFDLPEMDEVTMYRPPFEYPRPAIPTRLPEGARERLDAILRDAAWLENAPDSAFQPLERVDFPIEPKAKDIQP